MSILYKNDFFDLWLMTSLGAYLSKAFSGFSLLVLLDSSFISLSLDSEHCIFSVKTFNLHQLPFQYTLLLFIFQPLLISLALMAFQQLSGINFVVSFAVQIFKVPLMVLIVDGFSEIGAHVRSNFRHSTCLRHAIKSRAVTNWIFSPVRLFFVMRAQHALSCLFFSLDKICKL